MNALVNVLESEVLLLLAAILNTTARYHAHALDLGCSDRLMFANQIDRSLALNHSNQLDLVN